MKNADWLNRSLQSVWHPCTQMQRHETLPLVPIARAHDVWLEDFEGNTYLDCVSSWWVNLFGHGNPVIRAAIRQQLDTLDHVMLAGFTHQPVIELSEKLADLSGLGHAFYASDGASATEIALKMSHHFWRNQGEPQKKRFVHLTHSYHGETIGALSVTDVPLFSEAYQCLIQPGIPVPTPDWRMAPQGTSAQSFAEDQAKSLENLFASHHAEIAAFIVEPLVQGAAGMAMYHAAYLQKARELCTRYRIHLIADEIAVGFGRTGSLFAYQQAGITPDLLCLSKGITGGVLPLSAVLCTDSIYAAFYDEDVRRGFLHSHSYTGNPLACAAALATLSLLSDRQLEHNRHNAEAISQVLQPLAEDPRIEHFRHTGMIWAFDVLGAQSGFSQRSFQVGLQEGVLLRPIGNTIYLMPPYTFTPDHAQRFYQTVGKILDDARSA